MINNKFLGSSIIFIFLLLNNSVSFGQTDSTHNAYASSYLINAIHKKSNQIVYISSHDKVVLTLKGDHQKKVKGRIKHIYEDYIVVNGTNYNFDQIKSIISKEASHENHISNLITGFAGGITTTAGITLLTVGSPLTLILGTTSLFIGVPTLYMGLKKFFSKNKIDPSKGWEIETIAMGSIKPKLPSN